MAQFNYETLWSSDEIPAGREVILAQVQRVNGKTVNVVLRRWYYGDDEELHPSNKGLTIPLNVGQETIVALTAAFEQGVELQEDDSNSAPAKAATSTNGAKPRTRKTATARKAAPRKKAAVRRRTAVKR